MKQYYTTYCKPSVCSKTGYAYKQISAIALRNYLSFYETIFLSNSLLYFDLIVYT